MISPVTSGVTPSISSAISRQILTVLPSTSVAEVIEMMSGVDGSRCEMADEGEGRSHRVSCAVVLEASQVVGIVTERDIVRLTATKLPLLRPLRTIAVREIMTSPVKTLEETALQDIFAVLFLFRRYRIRHLPIVDAHGGLVGMVTPTSIRQVLRPANLLKMRRVADVMSRDVINAPASASVMSLAKLMADNRVSCVVIMEQLESEGDAAVCQPVGIVTERDIVQFQALGLNLSKHTAQQVMSSPLFLLDPQDSLWAAHQSMQAHRVRRLVVSWHWGKGLGIVTQTSLLRVFDPIEMCGVIDSLQQTLEQMEREEVSVLKGGDRTRLPGQTDRCFSNSAPDAASNSTSNLLAQATERISLAQSHMVSPAQRQQLQAAIELIKQVSMSAGSVDVGNMDSGNVDAGSMDPSEDVDTQPKLELL